MLKKSVATAVCIIGIPAASFIADAGVRQYAAPIAHSDWTLTRNSPLVCQLEHSIPRFGTAVFTDKAGASQQLNMALEMLRRPRSQGKAHLLAVPPSYKAGLPARHLAQINVHDGFDAILGEQLSWTVLTELEQGFNPTFYYQDGYTSRSDVEVALNSANFRNTLNDFVDCIGGLLPYGYEDVAINVLNYKLNSDELELESLKRLRKVVDYVRHDEAIVKIEIDAFSDSYGGRWLNLELSKKRAAVVQKFMTEQGVNASLVETAGYGERRHVASNNSPIGRHKNRRVVVRLTRDNSLEPSPNSNRALTPQIARAVAKQSEQQATSASNQSPSPTATPE
ncbi:OmpA family protein [Neiella marina]|uniref:OmpA family protein n=1 Tax=Neiella holothuriorum TaxID=2870530 RepID=A0ABS7EKJ3_9GAMM|nr:OmpA family protein [Neiella holothuriorum]MBW8192398.1 OmpA family protein [Neiella holothuriorum]